MNRSIIFIYTVHLELKDLDIVTTEKWKTEALQVTICANYVDLYNRSVDKTGIRFYEIERLTDTDILNH